MKNHTANIDRNKNQTRTALIGLALASSGFVGIMLTANPASFIYRVFGVVDNPITHAWVTTMILIIAIGYLLLPGVGLLAKSANEYDATVESKR